LDQRGFGDSEGDEGKIESYEISVEDNVKFHQEYCERNPYLKDVPKYLMSGSFGGQLIMYCHLKCPDFYTGIVPQAPYFRHRDEENIRKWMIAINFISNYFDRHFRINFGYDTRQKAHVQHWDFDKKHLGMTISMHTLLEFVRSLEDINSNQLFKKVKCPMLI